MKEEFMIGIDFCLDYTIHFYTPYLKIWISYDYRHKPNIIFRKDKKPELYSWEYYRRKIGYSKEKHMLRKYK